MFSRWDHDGAALLGHVQLDPDSHELLEAGEPRWQDRQFENGLLRRL